MLVELWSARIALSKIKEETLELVRIARGYQAMKDLLHCYQILDLTDRINWPWDKPGRLMADMSAFVELQTIVERLNYFKVADQDKIEAWVKNITTLMLRWKAGIENQQLSNVTKIFDGPRKLK